MLSSQLPAVRKGIMSPSRQGLAAMEAHTCVVSICAGQCVRTGVNSLAHPSKPVPTQQDQLVFLNWGL